MTLNPNIILAGQSPDVVGSMSRGIQTGQQMRQAQTQNALSDVYRTQGAGIMNGDQGALNALAGIDPGAAMKVQESRLGMDATRHGMANDDARLKLAYDQAKRQVAEHAASMSEAERLQRAQKIEAGLSGAAFFYQNGDRAGYDNFLRQNGLDPATTPFEQFPAKAAQYKGAMDAFKEFAPKQPNYSVSDGMYYDPANPGAGAQPVPGMTPKDVAPYTPEGKLKADLNAGRISQDEFMSGMQRIAPKGTTLSVDPTTGAITFSQGVNAAGSEPTVGDVYNPNEVNKVVDMIDAIAKDPNLDRVVGTVEGGGGNDIDQLNVGQRMYYGGDGMAVIEKIGQLQGNAWLAARKMLKGGGPITDYESRKAETAVARLSRAKSEKEFRAALTDLRDAIVEGEAKLRGSKGAAATQPTPQASTQPTQIDGFTIEAIE